MWIFEILPWWTWLIGTFGVVGIIALAIFAPAALAVLQKVVTAIVLRMLQTRIGVAVLVALIAGGGGYLFGSYRMEWVCEAKLEDQRRLAQDAAKARDAEITTATEKKFKPVVDALEGRAAELQKKVDDYADTIQSKPGDGRCRLSPDAFRLRDKPR